MEFSIAIRVLEGENDMYLDEMFGEKKCFLCLEFRRFILKYKRSTSSGQTIILYNSL